MPLVLMKVRMRWVLLAALVMGAACQGPRADSPELAFLGFANAARRGEIKAAYGALSTPTRTALEARQQALVARLGADAGLRDEPFLALASGVRAQPVAGLKVVRQDGTEAVLEVTLGEKDQAPGEQQVVEVKMVKEGARWLLDASGLADGGAP